MFGHFYTYLLTLPHCYVIIFQNTEKTPEPWHLGFPAIYIMRQINLFLQIGSTASPILLEQHKTDFADRVSPTTVPKHVCK